MADRDRRPPPSVGWRVLRRQLTSSPSVVISIFVAVLLAALALALTPRLFEHVSDEALREAINHPSPSQRNIAVSKPDRIGATVVDGPFELVRKHGADFAEEEMSELIRSMFADERFVIDSTQFQVFPFPGDEKGPFPSFVRFRYQDGIEEHSKLVAGSLPQPREPISMLVGPGCPEDPEEREEFEVTEEVDCDFEDVPVHEVAMTADTLSVLSFGVGDMVVLRPDQMDPLVSQIGILDLDYQVILVVSGVIELTDAEEEYWYGDERLHRAAITENADRRIIFATGLIHPDDYRELLRTIRPAFWRYTWRYFVDAEKVDAANIDQLAADLSNLQIGFRSIGQQSGGFSVVTRLPVILNDYVGQRDLTVALMSTVMVGLFATAIAVIVLLAGLITVRNRRHTVLMRNRGGSRAQMTLSSVYVGILLTVPASVLGYFAALWIVPGTDNRLSYRVTVALAAGATLAVALASAPLIRRRLGSVQREEDSVVLRTSGRRLVLEGLVVSIALVTVSVLTRRGQIDGVANGDVVFDPLLAMAPAMLGLATGILVLRAYPYLIRFSAWVVGRGRGLVWFVGFRRVLQQPPVARLPLVVILIGVAVAVFASVVNASIGAGQAESAWQAVGADFRITGSGPATALPGSIDLSDIDTIEASAYGVRIPNGRVDRKNVTTAVEFFAIESDPYQQVISGTDIAPSLPSFMFQEPKPDIGTATLPIPVIVSAGWPARDPLVVGEEFTLDLGRLEPIVVVRKITDRFPGVNVDRPFVVAALDPIDAISEPLVVTRTLLYAKATETSEEEIRTTVKSQATPAVVSSRFETFREVAESRLIKSVDIGLRIVFGLSIFFAVVAAVSSLALSTSVRRRDFGYLRTLGLESRQATGMTVLEQLPLLVSGAVFGTLLGIGIAVVLRPAIELESFTGGLIATTLRLDIGAIVAAFAVLLVVLAISVLIFVLISRGDDLGRILRVGDE